MPGSVSLDDLAGVGQRLVARLIDAVVLLVLNAIVNGYFFYQLIEKLRPVVEKARLDPATPLTTADSTPPGTEKLLLIMTAVAFALWAAYEVPSHINTGQTLGKRVMKIKVVPLGTGPGTPANGGRMFRRWLLTGFFGLLGSGLYGVGYLLLIVDSLWCTWDRPLRQCIHDKYALTAVVRASAVPETPAPTEAGSGGPGGPGGPTVR